LINNISSPILRKKNWWTLVHKPKSYRRACWPTHLDFFRETIFRPLGALAPQIFTRPTSPINCISSRTWGAGRPQVGLCPIFLVCIVSVGHCYDSLSGNPPRGLQFVLGTNSTPSVVDTIVMANLVCFLALLNN